MSLDNRIYVVIRSTGEYSDRQETAIVAFHREESAKEFVTTAEAQAREAYTRFPIDYTTYDDRPAMCGRREIMTLDPDGADPYDDPYYLYGEVPLFHALAIEAATAGETTKIGSTEGESAGPKDNAQNMSGPSHE